MTRKDMSSPEHYHSTGSSSQFHVQPFTGFLVTPNPGHLPNQPIAGQPTNLPANLQQGHGLGHFQQPPPYEPRVHPPTQGGASSGSRPRISRETHNELTPPHVLMVRAHPLGSHAEGYMTKTSTAFSARKELRWWALYKWMVGIIPT
jgi:hypothetical protein